MTPEKKANELVKLFRETLLKDGVYTENDLDCSHVAERCATIVAVYVNIETEGKSEFWQKVLQEICLKA